VKQETRIQIILSYLNEFKKQTSSENSSSEQSVDNDVVAVKVSYTKKSLFISNTKKKLVLL
jgi:hypothetical protein